MSKVDFSKIATKYENYASVQKSAAEVLLKRLEIGDNGDVLDLGCGVGNLTRNS
jgi:ubiquinone/menaquinone biosynthesis C-methylase UbiE